MIENTLRIIHYSVHDCSPYRGKDSQVLLKLLFKTNSLLVYVVKDHMGLHLAQPFLLFTAVSIWLKVTALTQSCIMQQM